MKKTAVVMGTILSIVSIGTMCSVDGLAMQRESIQSISYDNLLAQGKEKRQFIESIKQNALVGKTPYYGVKVGMKRSKVISNAGGSEPSYADDYKMQYRVGNGFDDFFFHTKSTEFTERVTMVSIDLTQRNMPFTFSDIQGVFGNLNLKDKENYDEENYGDEYEIHYRVGEYKVEFSFSENPHLPQNEKLTANSYNVSKWSNHL